MPRRKRNPNKPAPPKPSPLTYGLQTANDPSKNYLLTRLPPELRNKIYRLVLPSPTIVKPRVFSLFQAAEHREFTLLPFLKHEKVLTLARCCKQLYDEMIPIYYGENAFSFINAYDLYRFLYMIGPERRRWVRSVTFHLISGFRYAPKAMKTQDVFKLAFDVLADCIYLRKLHIGVSDQTTDGLPARKEQDLFAVKKWGCFDSVRGLREIDLRVREVIAVGWHVIYQEQENVFEMDVKDTWKWKNGKMFFKHKQILEFERALREDFKRPKEVENEDVDDKVLHEEVEKVDEAKSRAGPKRPRGQRSERGQSRRRILPRRGTGVVETGETYPALRN